MTNGFEVYDEVKEVNRVVYDITSKSLRQLSGSSEKIFYQQRGNGKL